VAVDRPVAVTNTTPVIALHGVGLLDLLGALFATVVVPFDVWDDLRGKPDASEPAALARIAGERAAISIAAALPGATVLLDEQAARKAARRLGLHVVGTLGVLVEAKRQRRLAELRPIVIAMVEQGRHLSPHLCDAVLAGAGERPLG
jgi:predicted nucleic acid-binding protein